jgi:hypothetical protein
MSNSNTKLENCHFTSRATLIALGLKVKQLKIMETIGQSVHIKQKTINDSPLDKLTDALMTILAGGRGLVEANKLIRSDRAIQQAFGRERCAEQSVISQTLNACTSETISQMSVAWQQVYPSA